MYAETIRNAQVLPERKDGVVVEEEELDRWGRIGGFTQFTLPVLV